MKHRLITLLTIFFFQTISCEKPDVFEYAAKSHITESALTKRNQDGYILCKQKAFQYFPFLEEIWAFDRVFLDSNSKLVGNTISFWIENNKFFLKSENEKDASRNVLITTEYYTAENAYHNLVLQGRIDINGENYLQLEERFSDKGLDAGLIFQKLSGKKLKIHIEYSDSILQHDTIFAYIIEHNFFGKNKSFGGLLNSGSFSNAPIHQLKLLQKEIPSDYFYAVDQELLSACFMFINHWFGWKVDPLLSNSFSLNSIDLKKTNEGYGNDDAWLSFICATIAGLINPIGGIIYGFIDTYIATHAA